MEDQIKAGKFTFPDEYWEEVSDEGAGIFFLLLSFPFFF